MKKHNFPTAFPVQLKNGEYYYASDIRAIIFNFLQVCFVAQRKSPNLLYFQGKSGKSTPGVISEIGFVLGISILKIAIFYYYYFTVTGKLHLLPPLEGLPAFNIDLKVMSDFLIEIANTEFIHHQFISYAPSNMLYFSFSHGLSSILKTALNTLKPVENPELPSGMVISINFHSAVLTRKEASCGSICG